MSKGSTKAVGGVALRGRRVAVRHHRGNRIRFPARKGSPDIGDLGAVRGWVGSRTGPRAIDLFCGAGGMSLGLHRAGFTVLVGADHDALAVETHRANLGGLGYCGDLSNPAEFLETLAAWGIKDLDLVAGGPPCQPFSRAGRSKLRDLVAAGSRSALDPRAALWSSFMTIVSVLRPRAVLVENVPELPRWDDGAVLIGFFEGFRELGYEVDARILEALNHGVPQHRARLFIIARRDDEPICWPATRPRPVSLREAIGDLPPIPPGQREDEIAYAPRPGAVGDYRHRMRAGMAEADRALLRDHVTRAVRPDDHEAFCMMGEGGTYRDLPEHLRRYRSDIFDDKYKRLEWDTVSRSITAHIAKDGYWYIHPEQHRTLSIREAARVQSFPDDFRFSGEPSHRYRQIGNAVPPLLAEELGRAILSTDAEASSRSDGRLFRADLLRWHRKHTRAFPWRAPGLGPWHVLMAEMCLRRTRADQVAPVFDRLLDIAPTPAAMSANAGPALEAMSSLGLSWRAENLVRVANDLCERFGGEVPIDESDLRTLPGVGDYVANAVRCFAFGRRAVLMDTNTKRIAARVRGGEDTRRWQVRLDLHRLAGAEGADAEFNYGLLDLGALHCRARRPLCSDCPVRLHCASADSFIEAEDAQPGGVTVST